ASARGIRPRCRDGKRMPAHAWRADPDAVWAEGCQDQRRRPYGGVQVKRLPNRVRLAGLPRSRLLEMLAEIRRDHTDTSAIFGVASKARRKFEDVLWAIYGQDVANKKA